MSKTEIKIALKESQKGLIYSSKKATSLHANTTWGNIEILPGHAPVIYGIVPGIIAITTLKDNFLCAVSRGILYIGPSNNIEILVESANLPDEIDETSILDQLKSMDSNVEFDKNGEIIISDSENNELLWYKAQLDVLKHPFAVVKAKS